MKKNAITQKFQSIVLENLHDAYSVCDSVWQFILDSKEDQQADLFSLFLSEIDLYDYQSGFEVDPFSFRNNNPEFYNINNLKTRIVDTLVESNQEENEFYQNLWIKMMDPILFPDIKSQVLFLCCLWGDKRIPYFKFAEGLQMSNEDYRSIIQELEPYQKKVNFILGKQYHQKTQKVSILFDLSEKIDCYEKKVVFWAYVLDRAVSSSISKSQLDRFLKEMHEKMSEEKKIELPEP